LRGDKNSAIRIILCFLYLERIAKQNTIAVFLSQEKRVCFMLAIRQNLAITKRASPEVKRDCPGNGS
jgi:hypothetical protein